MAKSKRLARDTSKAAAGWSAIPSYVQKER